MRFIGVAAALACALFARSAAAQGKDLDGVVNLNTAGTELLQLLPGVGPAKVRSIVVYRQKRPFRTVDELVRIKGIGRKMVRRLRVHLAVSGPSTAHAIRRASDAEPPPIAAPMPVPRPSLAVARKPIAVAPAPRLRPHPQAGAERGRRSLANHCPQPP